MGLHSVVDVFSREACILGDGSARITMIHSYDAAILVAKLLELDNWSESSVCDGEDTTPGQALKEAEEICGRCLFKCNRSVSNSKQRRKIPNYLLQAWGCQGEGMFPLWRFSKDVASSLMNFKLIVVLVVKSILPRLLFWQLKVVYGTDFHVSSRRLSEFS